VADKEEIKMEAEIIFESHIPDALRNLDFEL